MTKLIFKLVISLCVQCQTIDNFRRCIAVKTNREKQNTSARAGKLIEMALYRYPRTQSQKHNTAQSSLVIGLPSSLNSTSCIVINLVSPILKIKCVNN